MGGLGLILGSGLGSVSGFVNFPILSMMCVPGSYRSSLFAYGKHSYTTEISMNK